MAERAGFEPAVRFYPDSRLAGERLRPLGHLSAKSARNHPGGGGGIRTPGGLVRPSGDFKSPAFVHSATPPKPVAVN